MCSFRVFKSNAHGRPFGPKCIIGDKIGCRVNFDQIQNDDAGGPSTVPVSFTKNGKEVRAL